MDYGIAVRNKFELFLDDEDADPLEILRQKEEENAKNKIENVKGKDTKSQKESKSAKNKKNNKAQTTVQDQKTKPVEPKDAKKDGKCVISFCYDFQCLINLFVWQGLDPTSHVG